jgi:hypothetical protein
MFEQFALGVDRSAGGDSDAAPVSGPSPLRLIFRVLTDRLRRVRVRRRQRN